MSDNNYPLTKVNDKEYIEGYWFSNYIDNNKYPKPLATDIKVDQKFIEKLKKMMNDIENKKINSQHMHYRGYSYCRLCSTATFLLHNGTTEYIFYVDDIKYRFPEGLIHYYVYHNVQPSAEFYNVIMQY
jgi:hypothetical protein